MADDGSGTDITIPSFLMFKRDADTIKAKLRANQTVEMEIRWSLPLMDPIQYQIWTIPGDAKNVPISSNFWAGFRLLAEALGNHRTHFTPQYYIYNGEASGCRQEGGQNQCYNLCTNEGLYCSLDPDGDLDNGISGANVVEESLRRMCIWNLYRAADGRGQEWWDYVTEFAVHCSASENFSNASCISDLYTISNINASAIEMCMRDSGGLDTPGVANSLLDKALASQKECGIVIVPSLVINGVVYNIARNITTPSDVFKALCTTFARTSTDPPAPCLVCANSADPVSCVKRDANSSILPPDDIGSQGNESSSAVDLSVTEDELPSNASDNSLAANLTTDDSGSTGHHIRVLPAALSQVLLLLVLCP
jgi:hypothetical protein